MTRVGRIGSSGGTVQQPLCRPHGAAGAALAIAAALLAACSIDDGRMLTVPVDAAAPAKGIRLVPDEVGAVDGSNAAGIVGLWFVYYDAPTCQEGGAFTAEQCSSVSEPSTFIPFPPSDLETARMCTAGVAALALDYSRMFGAGIGLALGNGGPYDAAAHQITGFSFTIDTPPEGALRIEFPGASNPNNGAYWGGAWSYTSPVVAGVNEIRWADVGGPFYLANPPPLDTTTLLNIQFHIWSNDRQPVPFRFCISNLMALTD